MNLAYVNSVITQILIKFMYWIYQFVHLKFKSYSSLSYFILGISYHVEHQACLSFGDSCTQTSSEISFFKKPVVLHLLFINK